MPVVGLCHRITTPVGRLKVLEDDASAGIFIRRLAPNEKITPTGTWLGVTRLLKPFMLIRRMVDNQLCDDTEIAPVCFSQEVLEVAQGAIGRMNTAKIGDVVPIISPGRGEKGK